MLDDKKSYEDIGIMRIRDYSELALYELEQSTEYIQLKALRDLYVEKTADIVYLTVKNRLYGIICLGELLHHMNNGVVKIVTNFTKLCGFFDDEARKIFASKNNIQKIPVVDKDGYLVGDYSRWDDTKETWIRWVSQQVEWGRLKKYIKECNYVKVYVILPVVEKINAMNIIEDMFSSKHIDYSVLNKSELKQLISEQEKSLVLTMDNDELRGLWCIDEVDYHMINSQLTWITFYGLFNELDKFDLQDRMIHYSVANESETAKNVLRDLEKQGVKVLSLYNDGNYVSEYVKRLARESADIKYKYKDKFKRGEFWPVGTEAGKLFFDELLEEDDYRQGIAQKEILHGFKCHKPHANYSSKYYNVIDGKRKTCHQPKEYIGKIYFFGMCIFMGAYQEDKYTIASWLQKKLSEEGIPYYVENCGLNESVFEVMQRNVFHEGDIVIVWTGENTYEGLDSLDLRKIYEKSNVPVEWLLDSFNHTNHKITRLIADAIYEEIAGFLKRDSALIETVKPEVFFQVEDYNGIFGNYISTTYLNRKFSTVSLKENKNGCIVVDLDIPPSCYKVRLQQICSQVEYLIIFIPYGVINTKYSFEEYMDDMWRIASSTEQVLPVTGGRCVPHYNSFMSYYLEDDIALDQAVIESRIFVDCIAKPLNITCRFELKDKGSQKAKQYSIILQENLPKWGIQYIEIE